MSRQFLQWCQKPTESYLFCPVLGVSFADPEFGSVEFLTPGSGWIRDEKKSRPRNRDAHCTVNIARNLFLNTGISFLS
jgi:hypothetical protein